MLTTKAMVKAELSITVVTYDDMIDAIIGVVSGWIAHHCRRRDPATGDSLLERQTGRVEYPAVEGGKLVLACYPIESVSEIKQAADRDFTAVDALVAETDYTLDPRRSDAIVALDTAWYGGVKMVRVTYTGGYWTGDAEDKPSTAIQLPAEIQGAATRMAVHVYRNRDKFGEREINQGDMSISGVVDGMLDIARQMLAAHVNRS